MKHFACGSVVAGCHAVFHDVEDDGILSQVAAHARADHDLTEITPELVDAIRRNITTTAP
jgi:predicted small metal-binding protein